MKDIFRRAYFPEIHDVSAADPEAPAELLALLPHAAREKASFLAVPDWAGRAPLSGSPAMVQRLGDSPERLVLHGLTHKAPESIMNRIRFGGDNHSEFLGLSVIEAKNRLHAAALSFAGLFGRAPAWFCAPRWEPGRLTRQMLWDLGFAGVMERRAYVHRNLGALPLSVLSFDHGPRHAVRLAARLFRRRLSARLFASGRPFRLALHPADRLDPSVLAEIGALCARLDRQGWTPLSLSDAFTK